MKILALSAFFWLCGGFVIYQVLPTWVLALYGFISLVYAAAWYALRRGLVNRAD